MRFPTFSQGRVDWMWSEKERRKSVKKTRAGKRRELSFTTIWEEQLWKGNQECCFGFSEATGHLSGDAREGTGYTSLEVVRSQSKIWIRKSSVTDGVWSPKLGWDCLGPEWRQRRGLRAKPQAKEYEKALPERQGNWECGLSRKPSEESISRRGKR